MGTATAVEYARFKHCLSGNSAGTGNGMTILAEPIAVAAPAAIRRPVPQRA
ncbi:MAG: hypothetical protein IRZ04_20165 [Rhodospirillales bacterium]|nr:hypothetical protein [Rhodospirillales bacterium]